jgi:hypothetical protein
MTRALALLALLALPASAAVETITPISDILRNRDWANGKNFCVVGKPVSIEEKFGKVTGKHLFRGKLDDGTGTLELFAFGYFPPVAVGEAIEVCGRYDKFRFHKNNVGYHNEIEAVAILKGKGIASGAIVVGDTITAAPRKSAPPPP